jgi:hypothetical protein
MYREGLEEMERVFGEEDPKTLRMLSFLWLNEKPAGAFSGGPITDQPSVDAPTKNHGVRTSQGSQQAKTSQDDLKTGFSAACLGLA